MNKKKKLINGDNLKGLIQTPDYMNSQEMGPITSQNNYITPAQQITPISNTAPVQTNTSTSITPSTDSTRNGFYASFNTADATAGILAGVSGLLPYQQKNSNQNQLQVGYNQNPNGDGTQAIYADGGQIQPLNRDNFNALHKYAYQNAQNYGGEQYNHNNYGNDIISSFNQANPLQAINPNDIQRYQADMQNNNQAIAPAGFSPTDNKFGAKTMQQSYRTYENLHYDSRGNLLSDNKYGTNQQAADNEIASWMPKPKQWKSNDQGIPMNAPQEQINSIGATINGAGHMVPQKKNFHTDEDTDYSIDSVRTGKNGLKMKKAESGLKVEDNQFEMISPETIMFKGPSHANGGIAVNFNGNNVEVEGNESGFLDKRTGDFNIFGNMYIPGTNTKFKTAGKELGEEEAKVARLQNKSSKVIDTTDPTNILNIPNFNSGVVMQDAVSQKNRDLAAKKEVLADIQNAMLDLADKKGINPKDISKHLEANMGISMKKGKECFNGGVLASLKNTTDIMKKAANGFRFDQNAPTADELNIPYVNNFNGISGQDFQVTAQRPPAAGIPLGQKMMPTNIPQEQLQSLNIPSYTPQINPEDLVQNPQGYAKIQGNMGSYADYNNLRLGSILPEIALLAERPAPVTGQQYTPKLYDPYQVSFQDRKNATQADFNALTRNADAATASIMSAQKYNQDNQINAEEFRVNQGIQNDVTNKNTGLVNDANRLNLQLADQQMVRQAQAESSTRTRHYEALASIEDKYAKNRAENNNIHLIEAMSSYRYNSATGKVEFQGNPHVFTSGSGNKTSSASNLKIITHKDKDGNIIGTTETDYTDDQDSAQRARAEKAQRDSFNMWNKVFSR